MKPTRILLAAVAGLVMASQAAAQTDTELPLKLLRASKYLEGQQEAAKVAARVLAARNQGSDAQAAAAFSRVAKADLSQAEGCIVDTVYKPQNFSEQEFKELIAFFESPLGLKILEEAKKTHLKTIEAMSPQPMTMDNFTEDERREAAAFYKTPAFRRYAFMTSQGQAAKDLWQCIAKAAGVNLEGASP